MANCNKSFLRLISLSFIVAVIIALSHNCSATSNSNVDPTSLLSSSNQQQQPDIFSMTSWLASERYRRSSSISSTSLKQISGKAAARALASPASSTGACVKDVLLCSRYIACAGCYLPLACPFRIQCCCRYHF